MKTKIKITASLVIDIVFYCFYLLSFGLMTCDFFSDSNEYSLAIGSIGLMILLVIPVWVILYGLYCIISIIAHFFITWKYVPVKHNGYILILPAVLWALTCLYPILNEQTEKNLEAKPDLFSASLIESQRACEHTDKELYFKKNGQFLMHDFDRFSDDFCWTDYRIEGDTIFFKKKFNLMPSDTAIMKKDTLRFKGDTLVYKIHSSP